MGRYVSCLYNINSVAVHYNTYRNHTLEAIYALFLLKMVGSGYGANVEGCDVFITRCVFERQKLRA